MTSMAVLLPFTSCNSDSSDLNSILTLPITLSYILDKEKITEIGESYIGDLQENINQKYLKKLILDGYDIKDSSNLSTDTAPIFDFLTQKIKHDFDTNNIILIDGWILSKTEAQQCAYYFLINK